VFARGEANWLPFLCLFFFSVVCFVVVFEPKRPVFIHEDKEERGNSQRRLSNERTEKRRRKKTKGRIIIIKKLKK